MNKLTDYGFILLTWMAHADVQGSYNARDLAAQTHLPLPVVTKILKALARGGILVSHRGIKGGYALSRAPDKILVTEIISALEGPIALTECIGAGYASQCILERLCPIRVNWQRINRAISEALEQITLEEMTQPLRGMARKKDRSQESEEFKPAHQENGSAVALKLEPILTSDF